MTMLDSQGNPPKFFPGDKVYVLPVKMEATVIEQLLHWDYPESFWGNLVLMYNDGVKGTANSWQCEKI